MNFIHLIEHLVTLVFTMVPSAQTAASRRAQGANGGSQSKFLAPNQTGAAKLLR